MMVSIFIPTYNSSELISETLDSLLSQTYKDIEILCVDDESRDNTIEILRTYALKDNRIQIFQKKNQGAVPYSWNYIYPHLHGSFTLYMSHDDLLLNDTIQKMMKVVRTDTEIDCVIPSLVFFEKDINHPEHQYVEKNKANDMSNHLTVNGKQAFNEMLDYSIPGFALWRTSLIREIGMPTESFNSDEAMQRIWALNCRKVAFSDAQFGYRQSSESIVKGLKPYHFFSLATNLRLFKAMMSTDGLDPTRQADIQYMFYQTLFYLQTCYNKRENLFSLEQQKQLNEYFSKSYLLLSNGLRCPKDAKGLVMKLSALNKTTYNMLTSLCRILKKNENATININNNTGI